MNKTIIADSLLLVVAIIWGATFVLVQQAIAFLEPFTFNAIRFSIASLLLLAWLLVFKREQLKAINKRFFIAGFFMGVSLFLGYALQTIGLLYTTSSKAGFITGLSVVLVPFFAFLFLKLKPKSLAIVGSIVAAIGLFLLTVGDSIALNIGDLLVLGCAISFALHIVMTSKYTNYFPALLLTLGQIIAVSVLSALFSLFFEDWHVLFKPEVIFKQEVVLALLVTSVFATAFAFLAQTKLQQYTTPTRVALIFATEPVFAAITAYFWAGERLGIVALIGCALIFVGMIFAELPSRRKKPKDTFLEAS